MFEVKVSEIDKALESVNETAKYFQSLIVNDKHFYKDDEFMKEYAKKIFFKSFKDFMDARMVVGTAKLADPKDFIERNKH